IGAEDLRKKAGRQLTDHEVGVRHGERTTAAVAFWAGIGAGAVRTDTEPRPVEVEDRAAAGGNGVNAHHRHAKAHTSDFGFEGALVVSGEGRNVRGRTAHVEADDFVEPGDPCRLCHANDSASWSGENGVAALEQVGGLEA